MSKKLIAVASAAALALSALVGIAPATATAGAFSVAQNGAITETTTRTGATTATAWQINVPSADVLRYTATSSATPASWNSINTSLAKYTVVTPASGDVITVTSTGGVKIITAAQFGDIGTTTTTASGTQALTLVNTVNAVEFYVYTTSTTAGTVVVASGGNSSTTYITGLSNFPYKLNFTTPATVALGGKIKMTGTVKDAFGNDLTTPIAESDFATSEVGAVYGAFTYSATTKVYEIAWTAPATAQGVAVQATLIAAKTPTAVTAFGATVPTVFSSVDVLDIEKQVTALTAQVTALTAQLAVSRLIEDSVTQKKYNTLARKWNKANPGAKVALKK